jgi:hypothetical protein
MRRSLLKGLFAVLTLLAGHSMQAQTQLNITSFNTTNINGAQTLTICPGNVYDLDFQVVSGQVNAFAVINLIITDVNNATNPVNGTSVGSFSVGAAPIAGPSATINMANVQIPSPLANSSYSFTLQVAAANVTPAPATSNSELRGLIQNPIAFIVLDTVDTRYDNIFLTDSTERLLSRLFAGGPLAPGGVDPIPAVSVPLPDIVNRDSTINFCFGDSLFLWNNDSLSADEHIWMQDGTPIAGLPANQGHLWVEASGYYSLITTSSGICSDSSSAISVGDPDPFGTGIFAQNKGIYFNAYQVDTTLQRIGAGNLSGPNATQGSPTRFCDGDSLVISARGTSSHPDGIYGYVWVKDGIDTLTVPQPGDSAITVKTAGRYEVFITEYLLQGTDTVFTCSVQSNPVDVIVDQLTAPIIAPSLAKRYCYGDTVFMFDTIVPYQIKSTYQWFLNDQLLTGFGGRFDDTNFIKIDTAALSAYGIGVDSIARFQLRIIDSLGCDSLSDPTLVTFTPYPDIVLLPGGTKDFDLCPGDTLVVNAAVGNGVSASFQWFEFPTTNLITNSSTLETGDEGTYYVQATTADGCSKYDTITVSYYSVSADAGPDIEVKSGETVFLTGSGGTNYQWRAELGKPISANDFFSQTISVSYTLPDTIEGDTIWMYLLVTDNNGCSDVDSMRLIILTDEDENPVTISGLDRAYNLFSPNGDGSNDSWDITKVYNDRDVCKIRNINRWVSSQSSQT